MYKEIPPGHWCFVADRTREQINREAKERRNREMPVSTVVELEAKRVPRPSPQGTHVVFGDLANASANLLLFVYWLSRFSHDVRERVRESAKS